MGQLPIPYRFVYLALLLQMHTTQSYGQPADSSSLALADPSVFYHDKTYYLYGTVEGNSREGFLVYTSSNLHDWTLSNNNSGFALRKGDAFGRSGFWAPQVFFHQGKFYMAYVANEQIAIAESERPEGPFRQKNKDSIPGGVKQIDPYVFIDADGQKYLYHVRLTHGNRIFVAKINDAFTSMDTSTLRECIAAEEGWENTSQAPWPVAEGPTVFRYKNKYYLFYSANDFRNPDYAVGYATSDHPLGPWKKFSGNPVLSRSHTGHNGSGHGDFFQANHKLMYVFHTHHSDRKVAPRRTAIVEAGFKETKGTIDELNMKQESFRFLRIHK